MARAKKVTGCLYRHSEIVYAGLDKSTSDVWELVQSACEAILSKKWDKFTRGDLTANATHWGKSSDMGRHGEGAIDLLIEYGWIKDITPPHQPGKRGRRSEGKFLVNPEAHFKFSEQAERITQMRAERYEGIEVLAAERREENK